MKNLIISLILVGSLFGSESVDSAFKLCMAIDRTGLSSQKCKVDGWNSSISVYFDMRSSEARKTCPAIVNIAKTNKWNIESKWILKIYSPYSNNNTIAQCSF